MDRGTRSHRFQSHVEFFFTDFFFLSLLSLSLCSPMGLTCSKKAFADTAELVRASSTRKKSHNPRSASLPQTIAVQRWVGLIWSPPSV